MAWQIKSMRREGERRGGKKGREKAERGVEGKEEIWFWMEASHLKQAVYTQPH